MPGTLDLSLELALRNYQLSLNGWVHVLENASLLNNRKTFVRLGASKRDR